MLWHPKQKGRFNDSNGRFIGRLKRYFSRRTIPLTLHNIVSQNWDYRLQLDDIDRQNVLRAAAVTDTAFRAVLRAAKTARDETPLAGTLLGEIYKGSAYGPSFPPIIAGGENATILHYTKNNAPLPQNGLLLMDFGVRWHSMVSDVSRTIPLSGRYTPLQRLLYNVVLDTQTYVESLVKPENTIESINIACWAYLEGLLEDRFIAKGGRMTRAYQDMPHFVSHLMGIQVHDGDPTRDYRHRPLSPGMMLSNEPGLYGHFEMKIDGVHYEETLGIRIEDDLLVTKTGCENLTAFIPKQVDDIEACMV